MTKQQRPDQEFEEFMSGQTGLSHLYQTSETDGPNDILDQRILAAARKAVKQQKNAGAHPKRWLMPAAIAAGFAVLAVILAVQYSSLESDDFDLANQQQEREIVSNLKPNQDRFLDEIVKLVKAGELTTARDQYRAFIELYPDYIIDLQRYPELEQFQEIPEKK